jgi:RNA polymerase sigma-70 factor (ECF subfamily)
MTDQDLLRAYADSRDVESLGAFLARYQESLVRFVANYLRDDTAAQDIVQETFLRVARQPTRLLDVTSCHNWLLSVARNLSVDHLRKKIRRRKHTEAYQIQVARSGGVTAEAADVEISRGEVRERVRVEIDALKPRLRELMLLKVGEGKSYREIAEITGLSVTNVGYLIHQAMRTLKFRLKDLRETLE